MTRGRTDRGGRGNSKKTNYSAPALEKGLDILELLAHQSEGLTKSQLARLLQRSVSEIFRMLLCLEGRGYIAQVSEERYSLTLKLFQLVQVTGAYPGCWRRLRWGWRGVQRRWV